MNFFTVYLVDGQPRVEPTGRLSKPLTIDECVELSFDLTVAVREACELREMWERAREAGEE